MTRRAFLPTVVGDVDDDRIDNIRCASRGPASSYIRSLEMTSIPSGIESNR